MRFMILRKADERTEAGAMPSQELFEAMGKYMEEMGKAGVLLGGEGLHPSSKAVRVRFSEGEATVIDGPFAETKELVAGYFLIQTKSREEAIEWVKRWPPIDWVTELEIRQIFEADDFGPEFTPELRERNEHLRAEVEKR